MSDKAILTDAISQIDDRYVQNYVSDRYWRSALKRTFLRIELIVLALLVGTFFFFGFRKGIWVASTFYRYEADAQKWTYFHDAEQAAFSHADGNRQALELSSGNATARFTVEMTGSGANQTAKFYPENDPDKVFIITAFRKGSNTYIEPFANYRIGNYLQQTLQLDCGISDDGLRQMATGQNTSKASEKSSDLLRALLVIACGLAGTLLMEPLMKLDRLLVGLYYSGTNRLEPTELYTVIYLVLGALLVGVGALLALTVLLG